jgi:hypothetical protein
LVQASRGDHSGSVLASHAHGRHSYQTGGSSLNLGKLL